MSQEQLDYLCDQSKENGYNFCTNDVHDILIAMLTDRKLTRDQVEHITIQMEATKAVRKVTNYTIPNPND